MNLFQIQKDESLFQTNHKFIFFSRGGDLQIFFIYIRHRIKRFVTTTRKMSISDQEFLTDPKSPLKNLICDGKIESSQILGKM